jgi:hypothetical protein
MSDPKRLLEQPEILSPEELSALTAGTSMSAPRGLANVVWASLLPTFGGPGTAGGGGPGTTPGGSPAVASTPPPTSGLSSGAAAGMKTAGALKGAAAVGAAKFFVAGALAGTTLATGVVWNAVRSPDGAASSPSKSHPSFVAPSGTISASASGRRASSASSAARTGAPAAGRAPSPGPGSVTAEGARTPPPSTLSPARQAASVELSLPPSAPPAAPTLTPIVMDPIATETPIPLDPAATETPIPLDPAATETPRARTKAEVALVQLARDALRAGDAHGALIYLDRADREIPSGVLGQEREVLRIEALAASGRGAGAAERAKAYLAAHPESPFVDRVRSVIGR